MAADARRPCRWCAFPLSTATNVPASVAVTEELCGGQFWTRVYGRPGTFPQVVHSAKRFEGPTGLEEYVGRGVGMTLRVEADARGIHFHSENFYLRILGRRLLVPRWLSPCRVVVSHVDKGSGQFLFSLSVTHPLVGELLSQDILFADVPFTQMHGPEPEEPAT